VAKHVTKLEKYSALFWDKMHKCVAAAIIHKCRPSHMPKCLTGENGTWIIIIILFAIRSVHNNHAVFLSSR